MPQVPSLVQRALRRIPVGLVAVMAAGVAVPGPAAAVVPTWPHPVPPVDVTPMREEGWQPAPDEAIGYDISFPQCGGRFPSDPAFEVVGVNAGRAFTANPCLGAGNGPSQLEWAGRDAQLYVNTGNPGPEESKAPWPSGQLVPRYCDPGDLDSIDCAYDYGWNAAAYAYRTAVEAYVSLGWAAPDAQATPVANVWWLDVESGNSWRDEQELNAAVLEGMIAYLETREVAGIGIYSVGPMWEAIIGDSDAFTGYANWVAGSTTIKGARRTCIGPGFTGGVVVMTQYLHDGFDANHRC